MNVVAYDKYLKPVAMPKCQMMLLQTSDIKSVVCASYDESTDSARTGTVGICALTNDADNNLFGEDKRKFLQPAHASFMTILLKRSKTMELSPWRNDKGSDSRRT
jgi:hypothetical protein